MKLDHLWKAALGAATMLAAIVTIFSFFSKEEKQAYVDVYVRSYTYNVPPHYSHLSKDVREFENYMKVYKEIEKSIPGKMDHQDLVKISKILSDKLDRLWGGVYSEGLSSFNGYSYIRIYSLGSVAAKNPVLDLPIDAITFVRYPDGSTSEHIGDRRIELNDLYNDDLVEIWSWYKSSLSSEEISRIRLKHDTGVSYSKSPNEVWGSKAKWYAENYRLIEPTLLILGFFTLIFFAFFIVDVLFKEDGSDEDKPNKALKTDS